MLASVLDERVAGPEMFEDALFLRRGTFVGAADVREKVRTYLPFELDFSGDGCENLGMTKAELHQMVDRLPDKAVDGAAILHEEITDRRIDPDQAWFWTREWQAKEREASEAIAAGRGTTYESDEAFLGALEEDMNPLDADS